MKIFYRYRYISLTIAFIFTAETLLFLFGQPFVNKNHIIQIWCGNITSSCNSQDISDWYTPSHFLHGVIFFWIFYFLFGKNIKDKILLKMFCFSLFLESFWEVLENTPFIINKYREGTIAFDYSGDSILNSSFDILFMTLGFLFARKVGWKISIFTFLILEIFVGYMVKDNLTLNIIMLLHPFGFIKNWQLS